MPKKKHTAEEFINNLRESEVVISAGSTVAEAARRIGVSEQTFYRWRAEYGGLKLLQAPPLRRTRQVSFAGIRAASLQSAGTAPLDPASRAVGSGRRAGPDQRLETLATRFGRYGYRRITALLRLAGWKVNHKRVERIWRQERLNVTARQPGRGRLWLNDGSCVRLRPERKNHVWAYDFSHIRTRDGRAVRLLATIDEYTRECLAIREGRSIRSPDVIETLAGLMTSKGVSEHIRPENGPEFTARAVREWLGKVGAKTLYIEPGSPWENGYVEQLQRQAEGRVAGP